MEETGGEVGVRRAGSGIIWDGQKRGKSEREGRRRRFGKVDSGGISSQMS